jgi:MFS family permease
VTRGDPPTILADRSFRRYFVGQTLSGFGSALSSVALAFAVLSLSSSPSALGLVLAASKVPQILFALLGGALGDRFSRRLILLGTDAVRAVLQATCAVLLIAGIADVAAILILQCVSGLCSAMFAPAANGLINRVAPEGSSTAALGGLAMAGALVGVLGPGPAFAVDAATFAASTLSLARIRVRPLQPPPAPAPASRPYRGLLVDIGEGWRAVRVLPWLLVHCIYVCLLNALALSPFFVLGPLVAQRRLGGAPAWAAIAIAWTVGALLGGACAVRWRPQRPIAAAISISVCLTGLLIALAVPLPLEVILPAAAIAGWEVAVSNCLAMVALQDNVPDHLLARATSFESVGTLIAAPLGMGFAGLAAGLTSTGAVFAFATGWVLISSGIALATPAVRSLSRDAKLLRVP